MPIFCSNFHFNKSFKLSAGCEAGWSAFDGKCYKYFSNEVDWDDAEEQCVREEVCLRNVIIQDVF